MSKAKKMYFLLIALFLLSIIAVAALLYLSRSFMSSSEEELIAAKLEIIKLEEIEKTYRDNINKLEQYSDIAEVLSQVVPSEKDQAKAVGELNQIANDNGLTISIISFPSSDLNKKTTPTGNSNTTATTPKISQAKPIKGVTGVLGMDVNIEIASNDGSPITTDQILGMLRDTENNRRNMRINSINFNAGSETINLQVTLFIKP